MSQDLNKQSLKEAIAYLSKADPDFRKVIKESQLILDTRNATKNFPNQDNVILWI